MQEIDQLGIVAIGRNEGERLRRCLESLGECRATVVYVDSDSSDGSRELASAMGAHVVELDLSKPFTAARARNAGFERLMQLAPHTQFVQFVDGDCSLNAHWLEVAMQAMREHDDVGVVCGRRRERFLHDSVYNRLCDIEWDTPVGRARACGGDALMRTRAVRLAGGYDPAMIAGEEPDLCLRLQRRGFAILRLDAEMTLHDAAMTRWTQWWQHAVRTGHTSAELLAKYGAAPEHRRLRRAGSAIVWAAAVPIAALASSIVAVERGHFATLAIVAATVALAYGSLVSRVRRNCLRAGRSHADARAFAISCACAKLPETWGMLLYTARRLSGRTARWIEYKDEPRASLERGVVASAVAPEGEALSHST